MFTTASLGRQEGYIADTSSPQIRAAGVTSKLHETAKDALTWSSRPATPPEIAKYRTLNVHEPGKIVRHYGSAADPIPEGPFGTRHKGSDASDQTVAANIKGNYPTTEMARWQLEQSEAIYASTKHEPLGRGFQRGTRIPQGLGTEKPFGMTVDAKGKERARQALHIMFPTDQQPELDEAGTQAHQLYVRSHAAYLPGEQRTRDYDWERTGVDPNSHRFGYTDKDAIRDGVRKVLQPGLDDTAQPPVVVDKLLSDFKLSASDSLGTVRKLGAGERKLPADHAFGMPSLRNGVRGPSVGELMTAGLTPEQQAHVDADLGKSLREGWRNTAPEGRVFGVPSVRLDVPMPSKRSVSSTMNYGNEPDALQLLRPPKSVERGVNEAHYMQLRDRDDLHSIVEDAGIQLPAEQFEALFQMAAGADGEQDRACVDTFFRARHHVLSRATA